MKYEVINGKTDESHGTYETLAEAHGCVAYDGIQDAYTINAIHPDGAEVVVERCDWIRSTDARVLHGLGRQEVI